MTPRQVMDTLLLLGFVNEVTRDTINVKYSKYCLDPASRMLVLFVYPEDNDGAGDFSIHTSGAANPRFSDGRSFVDEVVRRLEESANGL